MQQLVPGRVRFGAYELNLKTGELWLPGGSDRVLLREQPFQVLRMLVERSGKIVTREEIKKKLWPNDTIVDFDHSINVAIGILRRSLGDSAEKPQYIETLARRGYRLLVPAEWLASTAGSPPSMTVRKGTTPALAGPVGKKVSHYRVIKVIGGGGMGMVYLAEDVKLGRRVALKFLPEEAASDPMALQRFDREAKTASALNHPNICTIYGIEEHEGHPFIAMELLEGETLLERIAASERNSIPLPSLLDIALQVCAGLQAAHSKDIIHRDIKPANIFLTKHGPVKILDFGLAKLAVSMESATAVTASASEGDSASGDPSSSESRTARPEGNKELTSTGVALGTASYMSPEQVRSEQLDARTDLFSFGLVLYEMACGRRAFTGNTAEEVQSAILNQTPPLPRSVNAIVPRALEALIVKATEKDRSRRYQSAAEMRQEIVRVERETRPSARLLRRTLAAAVMIVLFAAALWSYHSYGSRITLAPTDTIVLADINNTTGDPVLDDALNSALRFGLEQTPYLNTLGIDKVFVSLAAHKLPMTTKVTPQVARHICQWTNSKMLISSSIDDVGNRYRIGLDAVNCQSGSTSAHVENDANTRNEIVKMLGVTAAELRGKLGEPKASLARFNQPLEIATSSSLEALQSATIGYKHHIAGDTAGAIPFYEHAIELDPNFALAYEAAGAAKRNRFDWAGADAADRRAYELRSRLTEPSRVHAESEFLFYVAGEQEKDYAVLLEGVQTFPRDVIMHNNLATCLQFLGKPREAAEEARQAAHLQPTPRSYWVAASNSISANQFAEARTLLDEADARHFDSADLHDMRAFLAFLQDDPPALQAQWDWAKRTQDTDRFFLIPRAAVESFYGRFRNSRRLRREARAVPANVGIDRGIDWAIQEAEVGNFANAEREMTDIPEFDSVRERRLVQAQTLALVGKSKQSQEMVEAIALEYPVDTVVHKLEIPTIRAIMKLREHDPTAAVEVLRPTLPYELSDGHQLGFPYSAYIRGEAYLQLHDGRSAAVEFQKVLDNRGIVGRNVIGALAHIQLARAQKLIGDQTAARKSYENFLSLWKGADPEIPIYQQAKAEYARLRRDK